jgi:hypothetical protein
MVPTMLEAAILESITQHNPLLRSYRLEIVARDWTGVGCYTYFRGGGSTQDQSWDRPALSGPQIQSDAMQWGGGSLLWLVEGRPACLEIYAYGNHFPKSLKSFTLFNAKAM